MKSIIFGLALIAAVACDVSHLQGQGWSKDETGYKYPQPPSVKFDEPAPEEPLPEEPVIEELQVVDEQPQGCENGGSGPFCCINGADNKDCFIPSDEPQEVVEEVVVEEPEPAPLADVPVEDAPSKDYLPPLNNEYLPPALRKRSAQIKRQVPVRRVVQVKRQVPVRRVQVKRQSQVKRQVPVRRVVQVRPQQAKNYRVVRRI
ncbi:hypothetical protein PVAND_008064 [Polypedilum vanderplanki]|uniref:Uncharacterized protein n=1 Tax=Polypedilum vanderplanki TaxID=319348 RepID=A0A9J6C933_POLVA|nr:hypothetical protein PVAND_008064 [Polypedilum vanderplanki]